MMNAEVFDLFDEELATLDPSGLEELDRVAGLQTRVDRKYVVTPQAAIGLLLALGDGSRALVIGDRRSFGYESLYFDTPDHRSYRGAAHGRRRRFKVRTRRYLDSGSCMLEVKTKGGRGETIKDRCDHDADEWHRLGAAGALFVDRCTGQDGLGRLLEPVLTTRYLRSTLLDATDGSRTTIDRHLSCHGTRGGTTALVGGVVVETKSVGAATTADRWLWRYGLRPVRMSKFCTGMALLDASLPSNRWHRTLSRHFQRAPVGPAPRLEATPSGIPVPASWPGAVDPLSEARFGRLPVELLREA
jgi:hypothetical protein